MRNCFSVAGQYNKWANARLYAAAAGLADEAYRRNVGIFFASLHGTLNHLLLVDRLWLKRLTGQGEHPLTLDAIIHEDFRELALARAEEDERILAYVEALTEDDLAGMATYATTSGAPQAQQRGGVLQHLFNHQTHHRGHAHAALSILQGTEPPSLDLLQMQRGVAAPDLRTLAASAA